MAQDGPYAAGILPFSVHRGRVVFLVGKDTNEGTWSDFGGKCETKDRGELDTAQREFYEETCGMVLDLKTLKARMASPDTHRMLPSVTQSKHPYYMYLLEVPFDPGLRQSFRRVVTFLRFSRVPRGMVEKVDVKWVSLQQLRTMDVRQVFGQTLRRHDSALDRLAATGQLADA